VSEFMTWFSMGGYAAYVWPAYLITFLVLLANLLLARREFAKRYRLAARSIRKSQRSETS